MSFPQTLSLTGLTCGVCVARVQSRIAEHRDVETVWVVLDPPHAEVRLARLVSNAEWNEWLAPVGDYRVVPTGQSSVGSRSLPATAATYRPLILLLVYLILVTGVATVTLGYRDVTSAMRFFMGGFFIAFSFFKMLDLKGFAEAYATYDLVARRWPVYGWMYPFVELALGFAYLGNLCAMAVSVVTAIVMAVSLAGVLRAVLSRREIRCACLGTVFQLPMSTVTIWEDSLMLAMAVFMMALG